MHACSLACPQLKRGAFQHDADDSGSDMSEGLAVAVQRASEEYMSKREAARAGAAAAAGAWLGAGAGAAARVGAAQGRRPPGHSAAQVPEGAAAAAQRVGEGDEGEDAGPAAAVETRMARGQ